jgi:hypothetical protein
MVSIKPASLVWRELIDDIDLQGCGWRKLS